MKRYNLIVAEGNKEELIRESHIKQTVRNAAIALAIIFGSLVLYFCLVPALAEGNAKYIYFDNGLAMYETVEYSTDGGVSYNPMLKLSENMNLKPPSMVNVNEDYVWVTKSQIEPGQKIKFRGTDSGTVYDSMSNYQISSASREWGYDYRDFKWISEDVTITDDWDCYFAPAKAMQYKYNGQKIENGKLVTEYFITPEIWAHDGKEGVRRIESDVTTGSEEVTAFFKASAMADKSITSFSDKINGIEFEVAFSNNDTGEYYETLDKFSDGENFGYHIRTNGGGETRYVSFKLPSKAKVTVYAAGQDDNRTLTLKYPGGSANSYNLIQASSSNSPIVISNLSAGEYRIYADGKWRFCGVKVEYATTAANSLALEYAPMIIPVPETDETEAATEEFAIEEENLMEGTVGSVEELDSEEEPAAETEELPEDDSPDTEESPAEEEQLSEEEAIPEEMIPEEPAEEEPVAEEPIPESDIETYADDYGIQVMAAGGGSTAYFTDADRVLDIDSLSGNGQGTHNEIFTISNGGCWVNGSSSGNGDGTSTDGKIFTANINLQDTGTKSYSSIKVTPENVGKVIIYASINSNTPQLKFLDKDGNSQKTETVGEFAKPIRIEYIFDSTDEFYIVSTGKDLRIYAVAVYYDNSTGGVPQGPVKVLPQNAENRTFYNYEYEMDGITGSVNDVNKIGNESQGANKEGSYATGKDALHGLKEEYKDAFNAKATFYDYYSDWELAGTPLNVDRYFYETYSDNSKATKYKSIYYRGEDEKPDFTKTKYGTDGKVESKDEGRSEQPEADDPPSNYYDITFSEGTNTIAYTYQGDLWNQAIRDYYNGKDVQALYFGSNSWFTGNERYDTYPGTSPWPNPDVNPAWSWNGEFVKSGINWKNGNTTGSAHVYNIPDAREYLYGLFNPAGMTVNGVFNDFFHGFSNSRAMEKWVKSPLAQNDNYTIKTANGSPVIYFDEKFLTGENDKNSVYGKVYKDVDFDFKLITDQNDPDYGYYYYDSTKNDCATRLTLMEGTEDKYYMNYTNDGVKKADESSATNYQFYPFNSSNASNDFYRENLMFGMKLEIPFVTYTDSDKRTGIFKFSGDDDVWVYVDDTLALDIGGTHTAVGGVIDMQTGYAVVQSTYDSETDRTNVRITDAQKAAFAIGTLTRIEPGSSNNSITASFFDDTFTAAGGYTTSVDETNGLFAVTLKGKVTNKSGKEITEGANDTYYFRLVNLKKVLGIDQTTQNKPELEHHDLRIYYMERGLNSSNFKLSFKLADETQRAVEKVWADGADHSNDSVEVELYRTRNVEDDEEDTVYDFENGNKADWEGAGDAEVNVSREVGYNSSNSLKVTERGAHWQGARLKLGDNYTSGESYEFSAYAQYKANTGGSSSDEYKILYEDGFEDSTTGDWEPRDFANGANVGIWTSGQGSHTGKEGLGVGKSNDNGKNGRQSTSEGVKLDINKQLKNGFTIQPGNTYSFSVYVMYNDSSYDNVTFKLSIDCGNSWPNITQVTLSPGEWGQLAVTDYLIPENAKCLYIETQSGSNQLNNFYIDDFVIATAGAEIETTQQNGTVIKNNTSVGGSTGDAADAPKNFKLTINYGPDSTDYKVIDSKAVAVNKWIELSANYTFPPLKGNYTNYYLIIETDGGKYSDFYIDNVVLKTPTTYTQEVEYVGSVILSKNKHNNESHCSDEAPWYHQWRNLLKTNDGNEYTYFIREISVMINGAEAKDTEYRASYYDSSGKLLESKEIVYGGKKIRVYHIDNEIGVTDIVNTPLIELTVRKNWNIGSSYSKHSIDVDIYDDQGKKVDTVTVNAPDGTDANDSGWTATSQKLPKYRRESDGSFTLIQYYGIEVDPDEGIDVSYSSSKTKEINGKTVYAFDEQTLSLTVNNVDPNMKVFNVKILKTSALDINLPLDGASFELYESSDGGTTYSNTPISSGTTDSDGILQFTDLEPGKTYKLVETQSALGYKLDNTPIIFTVTETDGTLTHTITSPTVGGFLNNVTKSDDGGTYVLELNITNQPYTITMPSTGGGGIVYLYAGAIGMMIMAMILLALAERRREQ